MTLKDGVKNKVKKTVLSARWDKLRTWSRLQEDIEAKLKEPEKVDEGITLDIGPQLLHTLRHRSSLRCMNHFSSKLGEIFTAHYNKGAVQRLSVWMLQSKDRDGVCKHIGFETQYEITSMTFIYKHRVYLAFCTDLTLRVFTDSNSNFTEVHCIPCTSTILCLIYNREDDEVYAGGIGFLEEWRIHGAEHAASAVPGKKFITELTRNEWIRDIKVDKKNNQMFALHGNGICVVNYKTRRQVHKLPNRHEGPLKCCCYYTPSDYLVTGGADGKIKLFNGTAFNLIHVFLGHHGPVTSIEPHRKDTLLFSCSHDGTVRIWRMDSLQLFMRLDIGEKIFHLSLLGDTEFFFRTDKDVIIYTLNQFYQMFAAVESETHKLLCCRGTDKASRILGSTEDGSVRLFSPVTGLTLTLIYPMPSFQVLSEFAYDIHQDRLHTVLTDGKVLVYNTSANPCRALEIWQPAMEDEEVTNLLIVTVEFLVEDGTDIDNLVFAGLKSGQIILCESVVCILDQPTQAHIGSVTCLEVCTQLAESNLSVKKRSWIILSGGTDSYVKLWNISIDTGERRPVVFLHPLLKVYMAAIPSHICMYSNILSACIKVDTQYGVRWQLLMYKLVSSQVMCSLVLPVQMCHAPDEDHCEELTALDKCPLMNVMLTAGKDGYVKIWSNNNELLREMNFATPIYASCFANDRGDVIVGYGTHICSVSLLDYLPLDNLRQIVSAGFANYKDDARELPVNFDHQAEPWLDLVNLTKYPIEILERRKQKIEEEVIEKLKRASEKDKEACGKFVIFVDGKTTKVIRKEYADRLLNWAKGKQKLKLGRFGQSVADEAEEDTEGDVAVHTVKKRFIGKRVVDTTGQTARDSKEEKEYFDSNKLIEIYPSTVGKAMRLLDSQKHLGPHELRLLKERDLLKRDPIIAPDGYIPNSVIRSKLNIKKIEPPRRVEVKQWRLKPVPKANPDHMPAWWGQDEEVEPTPTPRYKRMCWEDSISPASSPGSPMQTEASTLSAISIVSLVDPPPKFRRECHVESIPQLLRKLPTGQSKITFTAEMMRIQSLKTKDGEKPQVADGNNDPKKSGWDDSSMFSMAKESMIYSKSSVDYRPLSSSPESVSPSTSPHKISKFAPGKPITYKMRSRRIDLPMKDSGTPDSVRRRKMSKADKGKKGFKLTSLAVDEDSSEIHIKETKSGRRSVKSSLNVEILQKLMTETWMPAMEEDFEVEDVLDHLISVLDSNNPMIYESVCTYVQEIFKQLGISEKQLDDCLSKLGTNLNHMNTAIKKFTLRTLQVLGPGKTDVLLLVLSKLTDTEEVVKRAAADAIQVLTGATDKDTLLNILDGMGITSGVYQSRVDEKVALTSLAERFGEMQEDAVYFDRIQNWVEGTTPGVFEDDFKREEGGVWRDDSRSRKSSFIQGKEASFVSEEKSGAKSSQETARTKQSSRTGTGSTMRRRLHDADGFSTISDSSQPSRLSRRMHTRSVDTGRPSSAGAVSIRDILAYHPDDAPSSREVSAEINIESGLTHLSDPLLSESSPLTDQLPDSDTDKTSGTRPTPVPPNVSRATRMTVSEPRLASTISGEDSGMANASPVDTQTTISPRDAEPVCVRDVTSSSAIDTQQYSSETTDPTKSSYSTPQQIDVQPSLPSAELTSPSYTHEDVETQQSLNSAIVASSGDINNIVCQSAKSADRSMSGSGSRPKSDNQSLYISETSMSSVSHRETGHRSENTTELSTSAFNSPYKDPRPAPGSMSESGTLHHTMHRLRSSTELSMFGSDTPADRSRETENSTEISLANSFISPQNVNDISAENLKDTRNIQSQGHVDSIVGESVQHLDIADGLSANRSDKLGAVQETVDSTEMAIPIISTTVGDDQKSVNSTELEIDGTTVVGDAVEFFFSLTDHEEELSKTGPKLAEADGRDNTATPCVDRKQINVAEGTENTSVDGTQEIEAEKSKDSVKYIGSKQPIEVVERENTTTLQNGMDITTNSADQDTVDDPTEEVLNVTELSVNSPAPPNDQQDKAFIISPDISDNKIASQNADAEHVTSDDEHTLDITVQLESEELMKLGNSPDLLVDDTDLSLTKYVDLGTFNNDTENGNDSSDKDLSDVQIFANNMTQAGEVSDLKAIIDVGDNNNLTSSVNGALSYNEDARNTVMTTGLSSVELDNQGLVDSERDSDNGFAGQMVRENTGSTSVGVQSLALDDESDMSDRFTPKDASLYKYYDNEVRERDMEGRPTVKDASLYKYCDNEVRERDMEVGEAKKGLQPVAERDSDYQSIAGKTSSQILERLSYQDSGIGRDMSEVSHGRGQKSYPYAAPLSPVKSGSEASSPSTSRHDTKDWRKFFELPNAVERRQMEQIKKEMAAGKLKQTSLPPISYFADDLPMLPGEAGTRLLQSVRVGEKVHIPGDGRHRIESVPGKLGMHTRDEQGGMSNFGIIQMQWTTGIPTVRDPAQPPQKIPQHRSNRSRESQHRRRAKLDDELMLPNLSTASPTTSYQHTPSYAWELPLPPPPPKDSRTHIPHIKREHDDYCKYYQLVKKKLHLYTSRQKERSVHLPEVMVKRLRENTMGKKPPPPRMSRSPTGYKLGNGFLLPPISLRQVIKTC